MTDFTKMPDVEINEILQHPENHFEETFAMAHAEQLRRIRALDEQGKLGAKLYLITDIMEIFIG